MTKQEGTFRELLSYFNLRELLRLNSALHQHKVTRRTGRNEPDHGWLMWHLGHIESPDQLQRHFPGEMINIPRTVLDAWDDGDLSPDQVRRILKLTLKRRRSLNAAEERVRKAVLIQLAKRIDRDT